MKQQLLVGSRVRSLRLDARLSQEALAERCGLSGSMLSRIESGQRDPSVAVLHKIADVLQVPVAALLADSSRTSRTIREHAVAVENLLLRGVGAHGRLREIRAAHSTDARFALARALDCSEEEIAYWRRVGDRGYRPVILLRHDKRREMDVPRKPLKRLQRMILRYLGRRIRISRCSFSAKGRDVIGHATRHLHQGYVCTFDIKDCFPSISSARIVDALTAAGMARDEAILVTQLSSARGRLPQGPPTSPFIQNVVFFTLDRELSRLASANQLRYSRYADDLALSGNYNFESTLPEIWAAVERHGFRLNEAKSKFYQPGEVPVITGIQLGDTAMPSKEFIDNLEIDVDARIHGVATRSMQRLLGQINWLGRFDPHHAATLRERLEMSVAERSRFAEG